MIIRAFVSVIKGKASFVNSSCVLSTGDAVDVFSLGLLVLKVRAMANVNIINSFSPTKLIQPGLVSQQHLFYLKNIIRVYYWIKPSNRLLFPIWGSQTWQSTERSRCANIRKPHWRCYCCRVNGTCVQLKYVCIFLRYITKAWKLIGYILRGLCDARLEVRCDHLIR